MTQKQYRNIDRYQDLLNRIAPTRLVEQARQSVIGHEGSLEAFVTALSFEVNRCVMLARGADPRDVLSPAAILVMGSTGTGKPTPSRPWQMPRGSNCSCSMSPP